MATQVESAGASGICGSIAGSDTSCVTSSSVSLDSGAGSSISATSSSTDTTDAPLATARPHRSTGAPDQPASSQLDSLYLACAAARAQDAMDCGLAAIQQSAEEPKTENRRSCKRKSTRKRRASISKSKRKFERASDSQNLSSNLKQLQQTHPMNLSANAAFCSALNEHLARLHAEQQQQTGAGPKSLAPPPARQPHQPQAQPQPQQRVAPSNANRQVPSSSPFLYQHHGHLQAGGRLAGQPPHPTSYAADATSGDASLASLQFASLHSLSAVATALHSQRQPAYQQLEPAMVMALAAASGDLRGDAAHPAADRRPAQQQPERRGRRRGSRKCRKVYGMEQRGLWCTQCKWKKACSRFCDPRARQVGAGGDNQPMLLHHNLNLNGSFTPQSSGSAAASSAGGQQTAKLAAGNSPLAHRLGFRPFR